MQEINRKSSLGGVVTKKDISSYTRHLNPLERIEVSRLCIVSSVFLFVFVSVIYQSMYTVWFTSKYLVAGWAVSLVLAFMAEVFSGKYTFRSLFGIALVAALALFSMESDSTKLIGSMVLIFVARNYEFDDLAKAGMAAILSACVLVLAGCFAGVLQDYIWYQDSRMRHGLGFRYTTYLSHYLLYFFLLFVYIRRGDIPKPMLCVFAFIAIAIFIATDSRNSFYLILAAIAVLFLFKKRIRNNTPLLSSAPVWAGLFPAIAIVSITFMFVYDPSSGWMSQLNEFLGGRLSISNKTLNLYGFTLFGQDLQLHGQGMLANMTREVAEVTFVDNSYCSVLINHGAVILVIFVIAFSLVSWKAAREGNRTLLLILLVIAIHSFVDSWWLEINYDVFMLLIGTMLFSHGNKTLIKKRDQD